MKRFKKAVRQIFLVLFIFLAGMGVGLVGGVPVPLSKRKEDDPLFKIELVEKKNDADE